MNWPFFGLVLVLVGALAGYWWSKRRRIQLQLTARTYGMLAICADILGGGPSRAVEVLAEQFLESRFPGHQAAKAQRIEVEQERALLETEITGNPLIDRFINNFVRERGPQIADWITRTLASSDASPKKKEFAQALGHYLGLMPPESP